MSDSRAFSRIDLSPPALGASRTHSRGMNCGQSVFGALGPSDLIEGLSKATISIPDRQHSLSDNSRYLIKILHRATPHW